jgi:type IV secretion system protein VirB8
MRAEPEVSAYLEAARGWDLDRAQAAHRAMRRAWAVAALACAVAAIAVVAVAVLTPLKTVQPYVIRVDNATGVVDVVPALRGAVSESEAVTRYLVTQYVTARERYVPALAESDYEQVGAYHSPLMNQAWAALWNRSNPESPLNVHADGSTVRVQVTAVSFLAPGSGRRDLAQVRFVRTRGDGGAGREQHYVATLQYAFGEPSKDDRLRSVNPLGFKVLEYRREPEVVGGVTGRGP